MESVYEVIRGDRWIFPWHFQQWDADNKVWIDKDLTTYLSATMTIRTLATIDSTVQTDAALKQKKLNAEFVDAATGLVTFDFLEAETSTVTKGEYYFDVQGEDADGEPITLIKLTRLIVSGDATKGVP